MSLFHLRKNTAEPVSEEMNELAGNIIIAVSGKENIKKADCCITRLRLDINEENKINYSALEQLGAKGVIMAENNQLQMIFGKQSLVVLDAINSQL